jgi:hypothetical protein
LNWERRESCSSGGGCCFSAIPLPRRFSLRPRAVLWIDMRVPIVATDLAIGLLRWIAPVHWRDLVGFASRGLDPAFRLSGGTEVDADAAYPHPSAPYRMGCSSEVIRRLGRRAPVELDAASTRERLSDRQHNGWPVHLQTSPFAIDVVKFRFA